MDNNLLEKNIIKQKIMEKLLKHGFRVKFMML